MIGIYIDDFVTVVTYKSKNVLDVLTEIAGLLVLARLLTLFLRSFNEWKYNRKIMKETNEDFREVFTYYNFKKNMIENQEMRAEIDQLKLLMQRVEDLEKSE